MGLLCWDCKHQNHPICGSGATECNRPSRKLRGRNCSEQEAIDRLATTGKTRSWERAPTHPSLKDVAPRWRPAPVILTTSSLCHNLCVVLVQLQIQRASFTKRTPEKKKKHTDWRCRGKQELGDVYQKENLSTVQTLSPKKYQRMRKDCQERGKTRGCEHHLRKESESLSSLNCV